MSEESEELQGSEDGRRLAAVVSSFTVELGIATRGAIGAGSELERDLGLGSLERVDLLARLEKAFAARLPEETFAAARTLADLLAALRSSRGAAAAGIERPEGSAALPTPEGATGPAPDDARTLAEVLLIRAERDGDRPHIYLPDEDGGARVLTYGDLRRGAGAVAAGLRALGLPAGSRAAIMLPTGEEFFLAFLGTILAGLTPVPVYPPFRADRIAEYIERQAALLRNAEARVLIAFDEIAKVGALARDRVPSLAAVTTVPALSRERSDEVALVAPGDLGLIQYTSGSTGDPKGVALTHANLLANVRAIGRALGLRAGDFAVSWLPLYHDMGLIGTWLTCLHFGIPIAILSPLAFLSRPERWLWTMHRYRATLTVAPNFAYDLCVRRIADEALQGLDLSSVRVTLNGAEPVREETIDRFCARFGPLGFRREAMMPVYGLAECSVALTFPPLGRGPVLDRIDRARFEREGRAMPAAADDPAPLRLVSCGAPLAGHEARLVRADGAEGAVPEREEGRLLFRGPSATAGYFRRPDATAALVRADGWLDSGDLAYFAGGELYVTGRAKDLIIRAGRNVHPREIEEAAEGVEGVRRGCVAAFGVADAAGGTESVCAVAETREKDPAARERIVAALKEAVLAATGTPVDRVALVPPNSIPKTSSGKIRRRECRALLERGELGRAHPGVARQVAALALAGLPARLARAGRRVGAVLFGLRAYAAFTASALVFGAPLLLLRGRPLRRVLSAFERAFLLLAGLSPDVRGADLVPRGAAVFVANHTSYLDQFALASVLPAEARYIAKAELFALPIIGGILRRAGYVEVERGRPDLAVQAYERVKALLAEGVPIVFFPEATFTQAAGLRPFRLGAFRVAAETGAPIVPIALKGTRRALPDRVWFVRKASLAVDVADPIQVATQPGEGRPLPEPREPQALSGLGRAVAHRDAAHRAIASRIDEPVLEIVGAGGA